MFVDFVDVSDIRQTFYNVNTLPELFTNITGDTKLKFLKEINLYYLYISPDCFIHNYALLLGVLKLCKLMYKICSRHDIADILLKLALNTKQSIIQNETLKSRLLYILKRRYLTVCPRLVSRIIFISSLKFKTKSLSDMR